MANLPMVNSIHIFLIKNGQINRSVARDSSGHVGKDCGMAFDRLKQRFGNLISGARVGADLAGFLRHTMTREQAVELVRRQLARRDVLFLESLERSVFRNPRSPYLRLLNAAGLGLEDVRRLVLQQGLEGALGRLQERGVYLSYEEFKGRREVVRDGLRFQCQERDFDNPSGRPQITASTGGTTGQRVAIATDLRYWEYLSTRKALLYRAYGFERPPVALYVPGLPDLLGLRDMLYETKLGLPPTQRWFSPIAPGSSSIPGIGRAGMTGLRAMGWLLGHRFPAAEHVPLEKADVIARWFSEAIAAGGGTAYLRGRVSLGLEVAGAATRAGIDLTGGFFHVDGEAITPARHAAFEATGARVIPGYGVAEMGGPVAYGCARPEHVDDVHLFTDLFALVLRERVQEGVPVASFLFTSLHPVAPKVLLNVEVDDTGVVEQRPCGCFMGEVGLMTHLHDIRSFSKVTAHGMNVLNVDLVRVLEEVLPGRFGGSPVDYQFLEEENGLTLLIDPRVGDVDEVEVISALLAELRKGRPAYQLTADLWQRAEAIRVERRAPVLTWRGKVLPLHFTSRSPSP